MHRDDCGGKAYVNVIFEGVSNECGWLRNGILGVIPVATLKWIARVFWGPQEVEEKRR